MTSAFKETQATIGEWASLTFGTAAQLLRTATRANEEMAELLTALCAGDNAKAAEEIADVMILLFLLGERIGVDVHREIDRKMQINRQRTWQLDGTGHGYHVG